MFLQKYVLKSKVKIWVKYMSSLHYLPKFIIPLTVKITEDVFCPVLPIFPASLFLIAPTTPNKNLQPEFSSQIFISSKVFFT